MKKISFLIMLFVLHHAYSQYEDFKFGDINQDEINLKVYARDTSAKAIVLKEFGNSWFDNETGNLISKKHVRIKILDKEGDKYANFEIPLWKRDNLYKENITVEQASTFNYENGKLVETVLDRKNIFSENKHNYLDLCKFALPNVKENSIVEVIYSIESPYFFNYRQWDFQSTIPKLESIFKASIPANYVYNIALKGELPITIKNSYIEKECFGIGGGDSYRRFGKSDCSVNLWGMRDIPAFYEEDYMTAPSNFISSIRFELSEMIYFNGSKIKITKSWKDVEKELKGGKYFGKQFNRGKEVFGKNLDFIVKAETDALNKAKIIYDHIKHHYKWNGYYGKYSDNIKKAYENKTGDVGDINLSLIAALRLYGFDAVPVICSTRENGLPIEIFPVLSNFNYVFCKVTINEIDYMLDATDPYLTFGMLPIRCINEKGRVITNKESYWLNIPQKNEIKQDIALVLKLETNGQLTGEMKISSYDYEAISIRKKMVSFNSDDEYIEDVDSRVQRMRIKDYKIENKNDFTKPLVEYYNVIFENFDTLNMDRIYFNPFIFNKWNENPFKSKERLFPVDFGAPINTSFTLSLEIPSDYEIVDIPSSKSLALPNQGGNFSYDYQINGNHISLRTSFKTNYYLYSSDEYHYIKELFNQVIQLQKSDIVLIKKST
ncbi:MAG: DUF3857 domain-containing protein [Marinilabiliaceae bacterium]|nr:DUF3857 domain-containing protein [Marinilabiliaceae bacterium]